MGGFGCSVPPSSRYSTAELQRQTELIPMCSAADFGDDAKDRDPEEMPQEESEHCVACGQAIEIALKWCDYIEKKLVERRTK